MFMIIYMVVDRLIKVGRFNAIYLCPWRKHGLIFTYKDRGWTRVTEMFRIMWGFWGGILYGSLSTGSYHGYNIYHISFHVDVSPQ
jgi:hypothetical protein